MNQLDSLIGVGSSMFTHIILFIGTQNSGDILFVCNYFFLNLLFQDFFYNGREVYLTNDSVENIYLKNNNFFKSVFKKDQICKDVCQ